MENKELDKILKEIEGMKTNILENVDNKFKSRDETLAETQKRYDVIEEKMKKFREEFVSPNSPVSNAQGAAAAQSCGLFGGKFKLPFKRALTLSPTATCLTGNDGERLKSLHDLHDAVVYRYWHEAVKNPHGNAQTYVAAISGTDDFKLYAQALENAGYAKADEIMNPKTGGGQLLDFTSVSSNLIDLVRLSLNVMNQFPSVPLPRSKTDYPALRGEVEALLGGNATIPIPAEDAADVAAAGINANSLLTLSWGNISFDVVHALGFIMWNDDMFEDSIVPLIPLMNTQAKNMIARAWDRAAINGDSTAGHQDSDVTVASNFQKAWPGLRKLSENNWVNHSSVAINLTAIRALQKSLGKYGKNPDEVVIFIGLTEYHDLLAQGDLATVDKAGIDRATLRTGVINKINGMDIVISEFVRDDLNALGVFDNTVKTQTVIVGANKKRFWHGAMRDVRVEQHRMPTRLANWIQADARSDFQPLDLNAGIESFAASGDVPCNAVFNIDSST